MRWKDKTCVNVFGKTYQIVREKLDEHDGLCESDSRKITVSKNLRGDRFKQTLLHEEFHAVFDVIGLGSAVDSTLEEIIVEALSQFVVEHYKITPK